MQRLCQLRARSICFSKIHKIATYSVSCLDEHSSRTRELADEAFCRGHARDDAARCDALQHVLGVPRHKVAVVDNVLLAIRQLRDSQSLHTLLHFLSISKQA